MSEISIRLKNRLRDAGITLEEAKDWSDHDLLSIPGFGQECLKEMYILGMRPTKEPEPPRKIVKRQYGTQYSDHKKRAKLRGIPFRLTYEQWLKIWEDSGHLHERGTRRGQYVMARNGDKGPYAIGNVRIVTAIENIHEANDIWWTEKSRAGLERIRLMTRRRP
jgi:hypothetical protein